jgi:ArsR family transcriptional regulator, zinc-responsive transcriptional repressor
MRQFAYKNVCMKRATGSDVGMPSVEECEVAAELLRNLANPVRLAILSRLSTEPHCVHELVEQLALSQPLVSQHLRILRTAGLVVGERRGRETAYRLADDHVAHIVADAIVHAGEQRTPTPDDVDAAFVGVAFDVPHQPVERTIRGGPR